MSKIGLFYGSNTGNTEAIAYEIKDVFDETHPDVVEIYNIGASTPEMILKYDYLIFGIPTWNTGELQDDWDAFLPKFKEMNMQGKKLAIFGLGDQNGYGYNFLDAVGILAETAMTSGAELWGMWSTEGYEFNESKAQYEDYFLGLGIDEEGQQEKSGERIQKWVEEVIFEFEL